MLEDLRQEFETTMTPLVRGIFDDAQKLFRQELQLARVEMQEDAARARAAIVGLSIGAMAGYLSFVFVCFSLVYLLATYIPDIPLWGAYALVAFVLSLVGWIFTMRGAKKAREIRGLARNTMDTLREGFPWMQQKQA